LPPKNFVQDNSAVSFEVDLAFDTALKISCMVVTAAVRLRFRELTLPEANF
jgi:hypothetical protein